MTTIHLIDLLVIGGYFAILLGISVWAARREKNESADYFLASRDVGWLAVGASLFASNIGSEHLVGLAGTGAASGLAVTGGETAAALLDRFGIDGLVLWTRSNRAWRSPSRWGAIVCP